MRFSSSFLSRVVLVLEYLTNAVLCIPGNEPSALVVNNNQYPLQVNYTTTAIPLNNLLIDWLRDGLDANVNYSIVNGQVLPLARDHFIELQFIRNNLLAYTGGMSIDVFNRVVQYANSMNNVFWISNTLNMYKATKPLAAYVADQQIHGYLCSDFTTDQTLVWQVVQGFLDNMIGDADASVRAIGASLANDLGLVHLQCP